MSYILDALKRAEQQRGGPARGSASLPRAMANEFAPRARWPWIVGGLGGLAVVVVATLALWPARQPAATDAGPEAIVAGSPPPPPPPAPAPRVESATPAARPTLPVPRAEPASPVPAARAVAPSSPSEAASVVGSPTPPPASRVVEPRPATSRGSESGASGSGAAAPSAVSRPTSPPTTSRGTASRAAPAAEERSRPAPTPVPTPIERPAPPVARVAPPRGAAPESPAAAAVAPSGNLKTLAAKLSIQVLSWAPERKDRFVFLNGRKYGEGQTIEDKIVVEQINEDSVVLAYQGERMILKGR